MNIRMGAGEGLNHIEPKNQYFNLPDAMSIDYVRVYKLKGIDPLPVIWEPAQLCSSNSWSGTHLAVAYYPGVEYQYSSQYFDFQTIDSYQGKKDIQACYCETRWVTIKSQYQNNLPNGLYPVLITSNFPDGTSYSKTVYVNVVDDAAKNAPIDIEIFETRNGRFRVGIGYTFKCL